MPESSEPQRCRLVLIVPPQIEAGAFAPRLEAALGAGDVASVILPQAELGEAAFQALAEHLVPIIQAAGAAAVIAGDTRVAGRVQADGLYVEGGRAEVEEAVQRYQAKMAVGAGGARTRHEALELGEPQPDFLFFGRFGYDNKPETHPRNLALGRWWAQMIEIPCIVMGGSAPASAREVAQTGVEFVALSEAVFGEGADPADRVAEINALLGAAPQFAG